MVKKDKEAYAPQNMDSLTGNFRKTQLPILMFQEISGEQLTGISALFTNDFMASPRRPGSLPSEVSHPSRLPRIWRHLGRYGIASRAGKKGMAQCARGKGEAREKRCARTCTPHTGMPHPCSAPIERGRKERREGKRRCTPARGHAPSLQHANWGREEREERGGREEGGTWSLPRRKSSALLWWVWWWVLGVDCLVGMFMLRLLSYVCGCYFVKTLV